MRFCRLILASGLVLATAAGPGLAAGQEASATAAGDKVDPRLDADVMRLIKLDGTKQRIQGGMKQMIEAGKTAMMKQTPQCSSAFADEWVKRMLARANVDDFLKVVVTTFKRQYNDADIKEMISFRESKDTAHPTVLSAGLKEKISNLLPTVQSEIIGGMTQIGAKLGGEVGQEIGKEHPEYCKEAGTAKD